MKKTRRRSTTSKTLSMPISFWAQCEEICQKVGFANYEECLAKTISERYVKEGLGFAP